MRKFSLYSIFFYFFLLLICQITIPNIIIIRGTTNIINLTILSCFCVALYVTYPVSFLILIVSPLSVKYAIEFNIKSLLSYKLINLSCVFPLFIHMSVTKSQFEKAINFDSVLSFIFLTNSAPTVNGPLSSVSVLLVFCIEKSSL